MADRTQTMTAIFTPGYAAPEQFAAARQGPWTDIYGLAATLYHAITGQAPPNAFDRLMEDAYQPLATRQPPGFARGLLAAIDAGLSVPAEERPQSLAEWRALLGEPPVEGETTVVMSTRPPTPPPLPRPPTPPTPPSPPTRLAIGPRTAGRDKWIALAAVVLLMAGAGVYYLLAPRPAPVMATAVPEPPPSSAAAPAAAPVAETRAVATPAPSPSTIEVAVASPSAPATPPSGEAEEAALHLVTTDRQRLQVALTALGFDTRGSDGVLGPRSREMIAAWQKARNHPETGYLTAAQSQALLREAQPALQRFDEDKKRPVAPSRRQPASASSPAGPRTDFP
jgi:hypothetical protein